MYITFIFVNNENRGDKMKRRKLKKIVVPALYVMSIVMLIGSVYLIEGFVNNQVFQKDDIDEIEEVLNNDSDCDLELEEVSRQIDEYRYYNEIHH